MTAPADPNNQTARAAKAERFRALHERDGAFVIPNPWDAGSTRILTQLGFEALATTSAGMAFSLGRPDSTLPRDTMLELVSAIAAATDLPVSADLESGYGDAPAAVAETIRRAALAGVVGGSIEDATGRPDSPIYDRALAVERIQAAVEAARALPFAFTLTARAENYLHGRPDLADTIARLQAYQEAGADVLYAPGVAGKADIAELVRSVDRPVNVVMGLQGSPLSVADLAEIGVKRISVGGSLSRAAYTALCRAAGEMQSAGTFTYAVDVMGHREMNAMFTAAEPNR